MSGTIDAHVHLYPPEVSRDPAGWAAANGERHWAELCTRRRRDGRAVQGFPTVSELLAAMDAAGIERAVLLGWYWETAESCRRQNRFYAQCRRENPDRLLAFAGVHPAMGAEGVEREMRRARDEGLVGLGELSPHAQGYRLDEPAFGAALALAGEWGWPVNVHAADPQGRPYPGRVATPLEDFVAWAGRFPATRFILAHWGGLLPLRLPGVAVPPNLHYDTAASPLEHAPDVWGAMVGAAGAERIVFGSDFPLNLYPRLQAEPGLERLVAEARGALPGPTVAAVMGENFRRLIRPSSPGAG